MEAIHSACYFVWELVWGNKTNGQLAGQPGMGWMTGQGIEKSKIGKRSQTRSMTSSKIEIHGFKNGL